MNYYVLLTFYNRQTTENSSWEVYGHIAPGINSMLFRFHTRMQAIEYSHTFNCPVFEGCSYEDILDKLKG